ncbi:MAG: hypothetical protein IT161_02970 [Bryobacterales bacterium]|nr:hypothetical protein [Bryobacterales bacterium]
MASPAAHAKDRGSSSALAVRRHEHLFFSGMAVLLLATVFVGFAPTYYLAGMVPAPDPSRLTLPSGIIRVHAVVSTIWMLLFATQVSLVAARRVHLHRRLGVLGLLAVCAMFVTGLLAGTDTLARNVPPGRAELLYIVNVSMVVVFAVLMAFAYRMRNTPPAHKRLVLVANIALLFAPLIRFPTALLYLDIPAATRASYLYLLPVILYDFWSVRRIHPATLWSSAFLVFVYEVRVPVAETAAWHAFAAWMRSHAL